MPATETVGRLLTAPIEAEGAVALVELRDALAVSLAETRDLAVVKEIRDKTVALRVFAEQAKDKTVVVDAGELTLRSERRLGLLLIEAERDGRFGRGRPENVTDGDIFSRVTLLELGIDRRLSANAQKLALVDDSVFETRVASWRAEQFRSAGRVSPAIVRGENKRERRRVRQEILGERIRALPGERFGLILADPEWRYQPRSEAGLDRAADNHYPTSPTELIKRRPVGKLAAPHCCLACWATVPMLPDALEVVAAWGFEYKSHCVWRKVRVGEARGTGYWFHVEHELLLIATRGDPGAPAPGDQWSSVIEGPVGRHSEKPEIFFELLEDYFEALPKIELNRRGPARPGWSAWGNEAEDS